MRRALGFALTVLVVYALACLALYLAQRSLIYFPQPRRSGAAADLMKLPLADGQINISTRQLDVPKALIYFGGNAEDVSGSVGDVAAAFPDYSLYLMHYRGYGGSSGKPSEAALFADALALFDEVQRQHPHVTVVGRSLGSGVAVYLASQRPVERLVLVTAYDSIGGIAAQRFPYFPISWILADQFASGTYAPLVKAPTTIVTAQNDELIPRASTDLLLTRFKSGIAHQVVIPDTGHNTISQSPLYTPALASTGSRQAFTPDQQ